MEMLKNCKSAQDQAQYHSANGPRNGGPFPEGRSCSTHNDVAKHLLFEIQNKLGTMMPWMTSVANKGAQT